MKYLRLPCADLFMDAVFDAMARFLLAFCTMFRLAECCQWQRLLGGKCILQRCVMPQGTPAPLADKDGAMLGHLHPKVVAGAAPARCSAHAYTSRLKLLAFCACSVLS
jgi:hypothetical protein